MPHHVQEPRSVAAPGESSVHEGRIGLTRVGFLTSMTLCSLTAGLFQKDPCSLDLFPLQLQASMFYCLCNRPTQSNAESWSGRKAPKSIPELSVMFLGLRFVHWYSQTFLDVSVSRSTYLEGEDAANEEQDCKDEAHNVCGHDVLLVRECPRLNKTHRGRKRKRNQEQRRHL